LWDFFINSWCDFFCLQLHNYCRQCWAGSGAGGAITTGSGGNGQAPLVYRQGFTHVSLVFHGFRREASAVSLAQKTQCLPRVRTRAISLLSNAILILIPKCD
jgi:hypothetical protein